MTGDRLSLPLPAEPHECEHFAETRALGIFPRTYSPRDQAERSARRKMVMRTAVIRCLAAALAGSVGTEAVAQNARTRRSAPRPTIEAPQFGYRRLPTTTLRPPDDGIIHWNTPNKDGNLGGPGTGGSGGGGG